MIKPDFVVPNEKYGFVLSDVIEVEAGVSSKTGKPFSGFAYFVFLAYGAQVTEKIFIDTQAVAKITASLKETKYLAPVCVSGNTSASGRFSATDVSQYSFD